MIGNLLARFLAPEETIIEYAQVSRFGVVGEIGFYSMGRWSLTREDIVGSLVEYLVLTSQGLKLLGFNPYDRLKPVESKEIPVAYIRHLRWKRNFPTFWSYIITIGLPDELLELTCSWPWSMQAKRIIKSLGVPLN